MQRRIWSTAVLGLALGAGIGYPLGNIGAGIIWGAIVGIAIGLILDRRVPGKPYAG
jgi:F0F1-type ATP synthase assembly protein I